MRRHRRHSIQFKRLVLQEDLGGASLYGLAKHHDVCRALIGFRVRTCEAGEFDEQADAAITLHEYEVKIVTMP